jgi:hypothetical protein
LLLLGLDSEYNIGMKKLFQLFFVLLVLFVSEVAIAQDKSRAVLLKIAADEVERVKKESQEVEAYIVDHGISSRYLKIGNTWAYLKKVENGLPYYISTRNLQARKTTGVHNLRQRLGDTFDLTGDGITVGVWDGGQVLTDHVEFGDRVINKGSSSLSNHATHVTGTITAAGINESSLGMAPSANILSYYAFNDDISSMAIEAANGLIISNHSYGLILGWNWNGNNWQWYGGSGDIDNRFGHYSSKSATLDDIVYNAPYYSIVWAVGNDRNDVGDGSKPPDGPYNIVDPSSGAKNVLAVGAITGFDDYEGTSSVIMSDFSCWGPTNDGRIKPDLVADGVDLLSTSSSGNDAYVRLSGTSMASPNIAGSLVPIQQYFRQNADTFMTAAALKALVIHTAREAGTKPGPDPQFGWGVMNTFDALKVLRDRNSEDTVVVETKIMNGESYEIELFSDGNTPLTATVAWTDPAGTPLQAGNTSIMLVNDLDIRIYDDELNEYLPWGLNPSNPLKAERMDNIRDNVEQIELESPLPRRYRIKVSHKGSLVNDEQAFGLVVTGGAISSTKEKELYWVAAAGSMDDNQNWSAESGGANVDVLNLDNTSLIFDNNGTVADNDVISLPTDLAIENFVWLANGNGIVDLNGRTLTVNNSLNVINGGLEFRNGTIRFTSATQSLLDLNFKGSDNLVLELANTQSVSIQSDINLHTVKLSGNININNQEINIDEFIIQEGNSSSIWNSSIAIGQKLEIKSTTLSLRDNEWHLNSVEFISGNFQSEDVFMFSESSTADGVFDLGVITILDDFALTNGRITTDTLVLEAGANLLVSANDTIEVRNDLQIRSNSENGASIKGELSSENSFLELKYRDLICYDYLTIENMNFVGDAVVNVLPTGSLINSERFFNKDCENLIYPNFMFDQSDNCANSIIKISNSTVGPVETFTWDAGIGSILSEPSADEVMLFFDQEGDYNLTLRVSNNFDEVDYSQSITVIPNSLDEVTVVENSNGLVSDKSGVRYQWLHNGKIMDGETERILNTSIPGSYQVAYYVETPGCPNRVSEPFDIVTSIFDEEQYAKEGIEIYPNPVANTLNIEGANVGDRIIIYRVDGSVLIEEQFDATIFNLNLAGLNRGIYLLEIIGEDYKIEKRILKTH